MVEHRTKGLIRHIRSLTKQIPGNNLIAEIAPRSHRASVKAKTERTRTRV